MEKKFFLKIFNFLIPLSIVNLIYLKNIYSIKGGEILLLINCIAFIPFMLKELTKKKVKKIGIIIFFMLGIRSIYSGVILGILSSFLKKDKLLKNLLIINIIYFILTIVLSKIGVLEDFIAIRYLENKVIVRHAFGFKHPNQIMLYFFPIVSILMYKYFDKNKKKLTTFIILIATLLFYYTYSRTTYFGILLLFILYFIKDKFFIKYRNWVIYEGIILAFFSIFITGLLMYTELGNNFSGRFYYFNYYLENIKISLIGINIDKILLNYPLDNFYIRVLYENGLIGFVLLLIMYIVITKILYERKDYNAIRILIVIQILGVVETIPLFYGINILYYVIFKYILSEKIIDKEVV